MIDLFAYHLRVAPRYAHLAAGRQVQDKSVNPAIVIVIALRFSLFDLLIPIRFSHLNGCAHGFHSSLNSTTPIHDELEIHNSTMAIAE